MSPCSLCEATEQPPAHTGMKAQSPHLRHAPMRVEARGRLRVRGRRARRVDVADRLAAPRRQSPGRRSARRRARSCGRGGDGSRTAPCARRRAWGSRGGASPRAGTPSGRRRSGTSRRRWSPPTRAAGAGRGHARAAERLAAASRRRDRRQREHAPARSTCEERGWGALKSEAAFERITGLKATREIAGAKSCAARKSSSAG